MRAWKLPAGIDTDQLAPAHALKHGVAVLARHCLESVRPEFARGVRRGDVIVAGADFGVGSSREQAAGVLVQLGLAAVVAPSFGGVFFRNAFNLGLLLLRCPQAGEIADEEDLTLDARGARVLRADGCALPCHPIPDFLIERAAAGGLLPELRRGLARP
jgi:3-isopropylmalate/(R)-2-methylmalate dehydratase small subunit